MRRKVTPSLVNLGLTAFAGLFAWEVYSALVPYVPVSVPSLSVRAPVIGVGPSNAEIANWSAATLARPLFNPTRRPPKGLVLTTALRLPRLSGVIITPSEKIAVFSSLDGSSIIVKERSRFGPFTVMAIAVNGVTVRGPSGVAIVRSSFSFQGKVEASTPITELQASEFDLPALLHVPGDFDLSLIETPMSRN